MKQLPFYTAALFFLLFSNCEKELPFPEQNISPQLVVNSSFSADSLWTAHISESAPVNGSNQPKDVSNAEVVLLDETGTALANFKHNAGGNYTISDLKPEAGRTYRIEANAPNHSPVTAQSYQPQDFSFTIIDTVHSVFLDMPVVFIDLEIRDNPAENNYYLIEVQKTVSVTETQDTFRFIPYHYVFDQNTENDEIDTETAGFDRVYLPDQGFNGQSYTTRLAVEKDEGDEEEELPEGVEVLWTVRVNSVSEDLYKYLKTLERYNLSNGELFAEPVEIYSNINGGLGIFGGFMAKEVPIKF